MSFMQSGGASPTNQAINYTGLELQTAINTLPVPIVYGRGRISMNFIGVWDFAVHAQSQSVGGKSLGGGGQTSNTYSCAAMFGLCEGPVAEIIQVWNGQDLTTLDALGYGWFPGTMPQDTWGYLTANHPDQALSYPGVAVVYSANCDLGSSASFQNYNFEIAAVLSGTAANGVDADPAQCIADFLTNPVYGARFPSASLDTASLLSTPDATGVGDGAYQTYCRSLGIGMSPVLNSQETASSVLGRWLQLTNATPVMSASVLKIIPNGDEVVTGNGVTYVPNLTVLYDFDDDDYMPADGDDPVKIDITSVADLDNLVWVEVSNRSNQYNLLPVPASDEPQINRYGLRTDSAVPGHEITDATTGRLIAQLILQRGLYVRCTMTWRVSSLLYCWLEAKDRVSLTEPYLGMDRVVVEITEVKEDDNEVLTITAQLVPAGVATAAVYPTQTVTNTPTDTGADPGSVN